MVYDLIFYLSMMLSFLSPRMSCTPHRPKARLKHTTHTALMAESRQALAHMPGSLFHLWLIVSNASLGNPSSLVGKFGANSMRWRLEPSNLFQAWTARSYAARFARLYAEPCNSRSTDNDLPVSSAKAFS